MTTPLPPPPTFPTPPPASTVTVTSTVVAPPPQVNITIPPANQGLNGWAVPIATLIAALVAAIFLTINEAIKRGREDRRQWDSEVRKVCVAACATAEKLHHELLYFQHNSPPPGPDFDRWVEEWTPDANMLINDVENNYGQLELIARPFTLRAYESLVASMRQATTRVRSAATDSHLYLADIEKCRIGLIDAVKRDIRSISLFTRAVWAIGLGNKLEGVRERWWSGRMVARYEKRRQKGARLHTTSDEP